MNHILSAAPAADLKKKILARLVSRKWDVALAILMLLATVYAWHVRSHDVQQILAQGGCSPAYYTYGKAHPEMFTRNYGDIPNILHKSLPMRLYLLAYRAAGIEPGDFLSVYIFLDLLLALVATCLFFRAVFPVGHHEAMALAAGWFLFSFARVADISALGHPIFNGWYYNTAESFGLLAVAFFIWKRSWLTALFLFLSFASHPAHGTAVFTVLAGIGLVRTIRGKMTQSMVLAAALAGCAILFWAVIVLGLGQHAAGNTVSPETWYWHSKTFQYDFFPVTRRLFGEYHYYGITTQLALWLLGLFYFRKLVVGPVRLEVAGGIAAIFLVALFGLVVSEQEHSVFLTRLGLHRGSIWVTNFFVVFAAAGICEDLLSRRWWRWPVAAAIMLAPFMRISPVFPVLLIAFLCLPSLVAIIYHGAKNLADRLFLVTATIFAGLLIIYQWAGYMNVDIWKAFLYHESWLKPIGIVMAMMAGAVIIERRRPSLHWLRRAILTGVILWGAIHFSDRSRLPGEEWNKNNQYLLAQCWARLHTPPDSLFMPDPGRPGYGWPDFSSRSSLGHVRDWAMAAWLYSMDLELYRQGMARLEALGINLEKYRVPSAWWRYGDMCQQAVSERFYGMTHAERVALARRFGIDYFVFFRESMQKPCGFELVYRNDFYEIYATQIRSANPAGPVP
jgi:hypothetical protein